MKRILSIRSHIVCALVIAGLAMLGKPALAADAPAPFVIPGVLPITGAFAFLGTTLQSALKLVEAKVNAEGGINGRPVRFDIRDDQSSPQVAVQMTQLILADKPSAIIGSTVVALCAAMEPLTKNVPTTQYCLSPAVHPAAGSFLFSGGYSTHEQYGALIHYLRTRKVTRIATIATIDATGVDGDNELAAALKDPANASLQLVDSEHFNGSDTSVSAQMVKIKAARPEALVISATGGAIGTVFRGLIDAGLEITVTSESSNISVPLLTQLAAYLPKDLVFPGMQFLLGPGKPSDPTYKQILAYTTAIKAANLSNDQFAALAWDPALLLVDAYRKLGVGATPEQVRDYIAGQRHWAGISGMYDFSKSDAIQRGLTIDDVRIVRWLPSTRSWAAVP